MALRYNGLNSVLLLNYVIIGVHITFLRQSTALSSATQYITPVDFGGHWGTRCLNTRFPSAHPAVCGIQREAAL